jgi:AcrR family transcriptional regulator
MATDSTRASEPSRSMALLWRTPDSSAGRPGSTASLNLDRMVASAVRLADADGLPALSMRRLAAELGIPTMTLYGHVPGKGELVDLMLDSVLGEFYPDEQAPTSGSWRARVEAVARANWAFFVRHPWALHVATGRPAPGPGLMRKYELELRAVDGLGLSEVQMDLLVTLINGFVRGAFGGARETAADQAGGTTARQWRETTAPYATQIFDPDRFPTAARVGPTAVEELQAAGAPERSFEFGLERLLDGIGVLILNPSR